MDAYSQARAGAVADHLDDHRRVVAFREQHLPDGLLDRDRIGAWIDTCEQQADATDAAVVQLSWLREDGTAEMRPVYANIPPGIAAEIAERLARDWPWSGAHLVTYLLTGDLSPTGNVAVTLSQRSPYRAMSTITLRVDPTTPVKDVADVYAQYRSELFGGERPPRRPSERLLHLFRFDRDRPDGESWADRARAWDDWCHEHGHDGWTYDGRANHYHRDVDSTRERLLHGTGKDGS